MGCFRVVVFSFELFVFCFKQKKAYEMRISDWSSDVCSSDLMAVTPVAIAVAVTIVAAVARRRQDCGEAAEHDGAGDDLARADTVVVITIARHRGGAADQHRAGGGRADRGLGPRRFHRPSHVRSPSLAATRDRGLLQRTIGARG